MGLGDSYPADAVKSRWMAGAKTMVSLFAGLGKGVLVKFGKAR